MAFLFQIHGEGWKIRRFFKRTDDAVFDEGDLAVTTDERIGPFAIATGRCAGMDDARCARKTERIRLTDKRCDVAVDFGVIDASVVNGGDSRVVSAPVAFFAAHHIDENGCRLAVACIACNVAHGSVLMVE